MRPHIRVVPAANRTRALPTRRIPLCAFRLTVSRRSRQGLERHLNTAPQFGQVHDVKGRRAILAITEGQSGAHVALTRRITPTTVHQWVRLLLVAGRTGRRRKKPTGRPPKLPQTQQHTLAGWTRGPGRRVLPPLAGVHR